MTLAEKVKEMFGNDIRDKFIGEYKTNEVGDVLPIHPEFADEFLETHGDLEIDPDVYYSEKKRTLVVEFKETLQQHYNKQGGTYMTVQELINKLQKCKPTAQVYTEQYNNNSIGVVGKVDNYNKKDIVYIADDLYAVKEELKENNLIIEEVK